MRPGSLPSLHAAWLLLTGPAGSKNLCGECRLRQAEVLVMDAEEQAAQLSEDERDYAAMPFELRALEVALDIVRARPAPALPQRP